MGAPFTQHFILDLTLISCPDLASRPPSAESDYFGKTEVVELIPGGKDVKVGGLV